MTIREAYGKAIPFSESDILLSFVLRKPKEFLYAHPEKPITKNQFAKFKQLVKRRIHGEPIAYLTGHKEFYGLDFLVNKHVLVPRPDTELLVDCVIEYCTNAARRVPTIIDVGTGSGNIAITLKHELPTARVIASDVSKAALTIAQRNAKRLHSPVKFYTSNVLQQLPKSLYGNIDIITFNAPYLTKQEAGKDNLKYEPQLALTPTGSPTSLIEQLLQQADLFLKPTGAMFFEMGHRQAKQVSKLCKKYFPNAKVTVQKDLGGFDRVVICQLSI